MDTELQEVRVKEQHEVFTPTPLVNIILDKIPKSYFVGDKTFCDPSCGDGQFLVEILKGKLTRGVNPAVAIRSIYGVDLMPDNIERCKRRLRKILNDFVIDNDISNELSGNIKRVINHNIVCCDALDWDFENWCTKDEVDKKEKEGWIGGW